MNRLFDRFLIKSKLLAILILSSVLSLLIAAVILVILTISDVKEKNRKDLLAMASLIANRSTAALSFDDAGVAKENLQALNDLAIVETACLYDRFQHILAVLHESDWQACPKFA